MFYKSLDIALKKYGVRGKQLAELTGISTSYISELRRGKANPSCDVLEKLLDAADQLQPGCKAYFHTLEVGESAQALNSNTVERLIAEIHTTGLTKAQVISLLMIASEYIGDDREVLSATLRGRGQML